MRGAGGAARGDGWIGRAAWVNGLGTHGGGAPPRVAPPKALRGGGARGGTAAPKAAPPTAPAVGDAAALRQRRKALESEIVRLVADKMSGERAWRWDELFDVRDNAKRRKRRYALLSAELEQVLLKAGESLDTFEATASVADHPMWQELRDERDLHALIGALNVGPLNLSAPQFRGAVGDLFAWIKPDPDEGFRRPTLEHLRIQLLRAYLERGSSGAGRN
jgi:hypothetical protein